MNLQLKKYSGSSEYALKPIWNTFSKIILLIAKRNWQNWQKTHKNWQKVKYFYSNVYSAPAKSCNVLKCWNLRNNIEKGTIFSLRLFKLLCERLLSAFLLDYDKFKFDFFGCICNWFEFLFNENSSECEFNTFAIVLWSIPFLLTI